jgi:hypothetical protein
VGFRGRGFKLSPMVGVRRRRMAELITQGRATSVDITPLRFDRFARGDLLSSPMRHRGAGLSPDPDRGSIDRRQRVR